MNYIEINNQKADLSFHTGEYKTKEDKHHVELKIKDQLIKIDLEYIKTKHDIATYYYEFNSNDLSFKKELNLPVYGKELDFTEIIINSEINEEIGRVTIDFKLKETGINFDTLNDENNDIEFLPLTIVLNVDELSIEYLEYTDPKDDDFTYQTII